MSNAVAQDQLRAFVERIERLEEEKQSIADDIKEVYAEAKGNGFDTKVLRQVIRLRKMDRAERLEQEALLELYLNALGMGAAPAEDDEPKAGEGLASAAEQFQRSVDRMGGDVTIEVAGHEPVTIKPRPGKGPQAKPPVADPVGFGLEGDV